MSRHDPASEGLKLYLAACIQSIEDRGIEIEVKSVLTAQIRVQDFHLKRLDQFFDLKGEI